MVERKQAGEREGGSSKRGPEGGSDRLTETREGLEREAERDEGDQEDARKKAN